MINIVMLPCMFAAVEEVRNIAHTDFRLLEQVTPRRFSHLEETKNVAHECRFLRFFPFGKRGVLSSQTEIPTPKLDHLAFFTANNESFC